MHTAARGPGLLHRLAGSIFRMENVTAPLSLRLTRLPCGYSTSDTAVLASTRFLTELRGPWQPRALSLPRAGAVLGTAHSLENTETQALAWGSGMLVGDRQMG